MGRFALTSVLLARAPVTVNNVGRFLTLACCVACATPRAATNTTPALISQQPAAAQAIQEAFRGLIYIDDPTFIGTPADLVGSVFYVRAIGKHCPDRASPESVLWTVTRVRHSPPSLSQSLTPRASYILTREVGANAGIMTFLTTTLTDKEVVSVSLIDQVTGRVDDASVQWMDGISSWQAANNGLLGSEAVCWIFVVKGFTQRSIVSRKFSEAAGTAGVGVVGINVNGKFHVSNEDIVTNVRFGLSVATLKAPQGFHFGDPLIPAQVPEQRVQELLSNVSHFQTPQ